MAKNTPPPAGSGEESGDSGQAPKNRPGFNEKGEAYPGVDPESGERMAVTYEGLQDEFGKKRGEEIYFEISRLGRYGITELNTTDTYPDLSLSGLKEKARDKVDQLFTVE